MHCHVGRVERQITPLNLVLIAGETLILERHAKMFEYMIVWYTLLAALVTTIPLTVLVRSVGCIR